MGTDLFVGLAFALAWLAWLPGVMVAMGWLPAAPGWLLPLGHAMPVAAAVLTEVGAGRTVGESIGWLLSTLDPRRDIRWLVLAAGLPSMLFLLGLGITVLLGRAPLEATGAAAASGALPPLAFTAMLAASGIASELGWRAWLLPRLQARTSALGASATLGVTWGVWHLPTVFSHAGRAVVWEGTAIVAVALPLAIVGTWLFNGSKGSGLAVGTFGGLVAVGLHGTLVHGPVGLTVAALMWLAAGGIVRLHGARDLSPSPRVMPEHGEHVVETGTRRRL